MAPLDAKTEESLSRLMLGCLLFRLGGEQSFTADEIDEIKKTVGGVQVFLTPDDKIIVRAKSPEAYEKAAEYLSPDDPFDGR